VDLLWWLSLLALIGATLGVCVGVLQIEMRGPRLISPYTGLHAWHHWLGLARTLFVLTWLFSGRLSMDDGTLFSSDKASDEEIAAVAGGPDWNVIPRDEARHLDPRTIEAEWFAFGGHIYRRQIHRHGDQWLAIADATADPAAGLERALLDSGVINATARRLAPSCTAAVTIGKDDAYSPAPTLPETRVVRLICGDDWFDIDAANGVLLDKLDGSRRIYRWLSGGLHRLDFPLLARYPVVQTCLIVVLCGCGFIFSLTGVVIGWRRLWRGGLA
jgi:hypothetical protein